METKRCPRCNKLLRIEATNCSRCGARVAGGKVTRKPTSSDPDLSLSQPTNPPASPHQAGHYSGLHPEDQPFQSSFFLRVQRPPLPETLTEDEDAPLEDVQLPIEEQETLWPVVSGVQEFDEADPDLEISELANLPTFYPERFVSLPETPLPPGPPEPTNRTGIVPLLAIAALLFFLLASGLLTFLFLSNGASAPLKPQLSAAPGELRVGDTLQLTASGFAGQHVVALTRDGHTPLLDTQGQQILPTTDAKGAFQVRIPVTSAWSTGIHSLQARDGSTTASASLTVQAVLSGAPHLQLGASHLDLGAGTPGTSAQKDMTLTNSGGGQVNWQATSNMDWLTLDPPSGKFAGSAVVTLAVNRSDLLPQAYVGQITFTQNQSSAQVLYVSMTVDTTPANLLLSTASMTFAGTTAKNPDGQTMVVQNAGGQALNWTATSSTPDDIDWLSVTPNGGLLNPNTAAVLTVNVNTLKLDMGTYEGTLNFSYVGGATQQVAITLTVSPPPLAVIQVAPQSLSFTTNQGFNPVAQSFTISNTGNATLNWAIQKDEDAQSYLSISQQKGSLAPGQNATVTVTPALGSTGGTINSILTIIDSDANSTVVSQPLKVAIAITNQPVINLVVGNVEFDHSSTLTDSGGLLIFSNIGNLPLNWSLTENTKVPWLSFSSTSGTLTSDDYAFITVDCTSTGMKAGTYTVKLTLKDSDANTVVTAQTITITLVIS